MYEGDQEASYTVQGDPSQAIRIKVRDQGNPGPGYKVREGPRARLYRMRGIRPRPKLTASKDVMLIMYL